MYAIAGDIASTCFWLLVVTTLMLVLLDQAVRLLRARHSGDRLKGILSRRTLTLIGHCLIGATLVTYAVSVAGSGVAGSWQAFVSLLVWAGLGWLILD